MRTNPRLVLLQLSFLDLLCSVSSAASSSSPYSYSSCLPSSAWGSHLPVCLHILGSAWLIPTLWLGSLWVTLWWRIPVRHLMMEPSTPRHPFWFCPGRSGFKKENKENFRAQNTAGGTSGLCKMLPWAVCSIEDTPRGRRNHTGAGGSWGTHLREAGGSQGQSLLILSGFIPSCLLGNNRIH